MYTGSGEPPESPLPFARTSAPLFSVPSVPVNAARLRSLAKTARELGRSCELDVALEKAAEEALHILSAASVSVSRLEAGVGAVRTILNLGDLGPGEVMHPTDEVYRLTDFTQLDAALTDLTLWATYTDDPDADPNEVALLRSLGKGSAIGAPLVVDGVLWGEFYATRYPGAAAFSDTDFAYLEIFTAILAGGISRARRERALTEMAYRDPLTGLANRRAIEEAIGKAVKAGATAAGRLSFVMIDVNGLKQVNDTYGHDAGDRVLTTVASMLITHFGGLHGSLIARLGGDEFAVLVPDQPPERVVSAAWSLSHGSEHLPHGAGLACGITSRLVKQAGVSAEELLRAADEAQYCAKRSGRRSSVAVAEIQ